MSENTELACPNCQHENREGYQFCEKCGQKNMPLKITFWGFIKDFFDVVFNLDNRFWRTFRNLFIPGKLTKLFFEGKRQAFYHPLRLYLVAILFFFTILSILKMDKLMLANNSLHLGNSYQKQKLVVDQKDLLLSTLDSLKENDPIYAQNGLLDSLEKELFLIHNRDTIYLNNQNRKDSHNLTVFFTSLNLSEDELFIEDVDSVLVKKEIETFPRRLITRQYIKSVRDLGSFNNYLFANLTWLLIAIIPIFSLILKLFYIRRKRFYMEHFVFLLHLFTALIFTCGLLMAIILPFEEKVLCAILIYLLILIYPFLAFKFYYGQGFFKTILKYIGIGAFFLLAFIFTFLFFLLITAAFF